MRLKFVSLVVLSMALLLGSGVGTSHAFYQSPPGLTLFTETLRGSDATSLATQIGIAAPDPAPTVAPVTGVTHYTIGIQQFTDRLHSFFAPSSTTLWGYVPTNYLVAGPPTPRHLGGIIVAERGVPIQITFRNQLTSDKTPTGTALASPIPVDTTIPGVNTAMPNRTAVHLHGGLVPWISDGGPFDWFTPAGAHGASFLNNAVFNPTPLTVGDAEYYYPNNQSARFVWYHDHAYGITRTNAYAGVASGYIIRDTFEAGLGLPRIENSVLAPGLSSAEIPIVIQDKIFVGPSIKTAVGGDPTWTGPTTVGSLWYAHVYEKARWKMQGNFAKGNTIPVDPSVIPEFFGDTMLVNGTVYPKVAVEPKRYRLRILNACNARFLNLQLFVDDSTAALPNRNGITLNAATGIPTNLPGPAWTVLGTEGGFIQNPVAVPSNVPFNPVTLTGSLVTGNAERWDVIVDFSAFANKSIVLYNDAPAPFPIGDPRNDYFPGWNIKANPVNATTLAGQGPNTRVIMRFDVAGAVTSGDAGAPLINANWNNKPIGIDPFLAVGGVPAPGVVVKTVRPLTLNETFDAYGRLIQLLGTNVPLVKGTYGRAYIDPVTENPVEGDVEIWEIANLTGDTHPIHFHLVNVQILDRRPFKVGQYTGVPMYLGPAVPPTPQENGWKETVRMNPGEVTRVIMKFDVPRITGPDGVTNITTTANAATGQLAITNGKPPLSSRTGLTTGYEYVWHCHILEHEEHDMMRPLLVTPNGLP